MKWYEKPPKQTENTKKNSLPVGPDMAKIKGKTMINILCLLTEKRMLGLEWILYKTET